jgi:hypothetical protein
MFPLPNTARAIDGCLDRPYQDPASMRWAAELEVRVSGGPEYQDADYPPVARWDWDPVHHQYYIGIKCGAAWCEVGQSGFTASNTHAGLAQDFFPAPDPNNLLERRVVEIKGWYDEQPLAVYDRTLGTIRPTALIATVFPDYGLDAIRDQSAFDGEWVRMARVALRLHHPWAMGDIDQTLEDLSNYILKFNFALTGDSPVLNEVFICRGSAQACGVPAAFTTDECDPETTDGADWWVKLRRAGQENDSRSLYGCVTYRMVTMGFRIPGTVRFRWLADDEGAWVPCVLGCCEVRGSFT